MTSCVALVVAAGSGQRFGGEVPKQYLPLAGRPVIRHALETLAGHPGIGAVRVVLNPDHRPLYDEAVTGLKLLPPVAGGASRQESVLNGLESLAGLKPDYVLIHDAARPFVTRGIIDRTLASLATGPAALVAVPVTDTLKRAAERTVTGTVDRSDLWRAQTPQGFRYPEILAAHRQSAGAALTDDAAVAEAACLPVSLVMGADDNFKITTAEDLQRAERLLGGGATEFRTGSGYDVHRFAAGSSVTLCGVRIAHSHGLEGHSDADVGLHALTDALLGAIGAGDIGSHFPPSDPQWRGVDSARFLAHAAALVAARGGRVNHVDVTLVCERPKIAPHRAAMVSRIAEILGLEPDRVSVKATTTEGLGFTGRSEGIAGHAIATVALPARGQSRHAQR
ncbi:MAG TPA: bifunctional 2-C-methyl-D-erythritol 4-phosphate cytidylyltransferase/2-C-methyl-D-erythritol 2,4-cyclodiphosphate synthase [Dongiaceae bacterium]|jgi:2-C-methyl-D-erythritol 4-phosphate cytidylyltransferase/2-C-methyl-D-erythritol 2,4-cyclodiphosphate synthase|nr:bifunctional 2-C-methyl-D-erythritol 4-phosphate cytidylyltransferase/2-C-methyl-D-erythritol 2,4-cyclodiphosphate synthase [Dongiaceae bacterium]